ncbi:MAG: hydantoinase/oxoprolinase N-terminal domain-containing protein, partial [Thermodesulfobacteriota bacterium]|nr:hydantoinase/oxoprolinase N-terminal domain-containing protein [Thermodesulfobacteriota bacterium]
MEEKKYIIGIDTGGTFTDSVVVDGEGNIYEGKALTNYKDFKEGVIASIEDA